MHRTRNAAYGQPYRGFESPPLRHSPTIVRESGDRGGLKQLALKAGLSALQPDPLIDSLWQLPKPLGSRSLCFIDACKSAVGYIRMLHIGRMRTLLPISRI
ncbi:hypothetical protein RHIZ404_190401 [Rhizobium sp. EC-SD404]|nr:hypothetical protein RHIZ404_190401 [Rhizobium sp. EC-SD404]